MVSFTDLSQLLHSEATNFSAYPRMARKQKRIINVLGQYSFVIISENLPTRLNVAANAIPQYSLLDLTVAPPDIAIKCRTKVLNHLLAGQIFTTAANFATIQLNNVYIINISRTICAVGAKNYFAR